MIKSLVKTSVWLLVASGIGTGTYWYLENQKHFPSTEDAYVQADKVQIAAGVAGKVMRINTKDHAHVRKNEIMLQIDPTPYQIAYEQALAEQQSISEKLKAARSNIEAAKALVSQRHSELDQAHRQLDRTLALAKKHINTIADKDKATTQFKMAQAGLKASFSKLQAAQQMAGRTGQNNAKLRIAKANVSKAKWTLDNTKITAPTNGVASQFSVRTGDSVGIGRPLFTLIEDNSFWISANFKETALTRMKLGQSVTILLDMYPDKTFHGHIKSISHSSGSSMALLPSENATGNWVKVTQRFPIFISIDDADASYPMRLGASAKVTVNTTNHTRHG